MKLFEFEDNDVLSGYYNQENDELRTKHVTDTRKPVLTLKALNRLKRMRALKKLQDKKREDLLGNIYGEPASPEGGAPGGSPF
jgi:hypothetical protein